MIAIEVSRFLAVDELEQGIEEVAETSTAPLRRALRRSRCRASSALRRPASSASGVVLTGPRSRGFGACARAGIAGVTPV